MARGGGDIVSRLTASDRAARVLAIIPWIVERGAPTTGEVCGRFGIAESELRADLDALQYVGTYPRTMAELNEVSFHGDQVEIIPGPYFRRPLNLTPAQAISVIAAAKAASVIPGSDSSGPLQRALTKLETKVFGGTGSMIEVELGAADSLVLDSLRTGVDERRHVEIDYYSFHRDHRSTRRIDPYRVSHHDGSWNVVAYCHSAKGLRRFRVDRIAAAKVLDSTFDRPAKLDLGAGYQPSPDAPRVRLRLEPVAAWVAETFPNDGVEPQDDSSTIVTLAVESDIWFARLLVRLGANGRIDSVSGADDEREAELRRLAADEAAAILERYRR